MSRSRIRSQLSNRYPNPSKLRLTELNSHVICDDKDLLYEEAPQAYKPIETVIQDQIDAGKNLTSTMFFLFCNSSNF